MLNCLIAFHFICFLVIWALFSVFYSRTDLNCCCFYSEWGHHFVCKRKYHFIIPSKENWDAPLDEFFLDFESHILYGLIHCNGYGHLIGVNGLKNNSKFLRADDSMKFWDRLCTVLKARFISLLSFPLANLSNFMLP